jgi:beta-D-xylosidase 4
MLALASALPATIVLNNPCLDSSTPYHAQPWCDATLAIDARVKDMLSRMTMAEKLNNLDTGAGAIASLGLNSYNWWEEASTGVSAGQQTTKFAFPITTGMSFVRQRASTACFLAPQPLARPEADQSNPAATCSRMACPRKHPAPLDVNRHSRPQNRTLWQLTGRQIGHEARSLMNAGQAGSTFWAPVINLAREPRWGRNIEGDHAAPRTLASPCTLALTSPLIGPRVAWDST